jgi:hypothetical protein
LTGDLVPTDQRPVGASRRNRHKFSMDPEVPDGPGCEHEQKSETERTKVGHPSRRPRWDRYGGPARRNRYQDQGDRPQQSQNAEEASGEGRAR